MSENLPQQKPSEEVDLGQLFNLIGNAFYKFFAFIGAIFKAIFSVFIFALKAIIVNFKIIVITMIIASLLGYGLEKMKPDTYKSTMLVKPYFDSKYQLVTNINYYNALISNKNYEALSRIFEISEEEVKDIGGFEILPGPETENERIIQYDNFIKKVDSARAQDISYDDFVEKRSIYSSDFFEISVTASKKNVFPKLEEGLNNSFTNVYSLKKMEKRDSLISIQKANIIEQIAQIDSLQMIYIKVLEDESQTKSKGLSLGSEGFALTNDKTTTREYDLLTTEMKLRNELKQLEELKIEEDVFFDVISSFQDVGNKTSKWYDKYALIFPVLAFFILCIVYLTRKIITYVTNYEA